MRRLNQIQPDGNAAAHSAVTRRFRAISNKIPWALFLMFGSLACFAAGQTTEANSADCHRKPATQTPPLSIPSESPSALAGGAVSGGRVQKVIVVGFVGGFARGNDQKHPEVQFAELLRERYGSDIFTAVFANHEGKKALNTVLHLLGGKERSGAISSIEEDCPRILLYGHSWGAAEVVIFARELGKMGIPVFLTIQVDSIAKPGHDDARIPANVTKAINLYQSRGPLHGRTSIFASEPTRTTIIGNLHMTYEGRRINCDNYPWFARTFNRPHHEIENDPRVWAIASSLIDSAFDTSAR